MLSKVSKFAEWNKVNSLIQLVVVRILVFNMDDADCMWWECNWTQYYHVCTEGVSNAVSRSS